VKPVYEIAAARPQDLALLPTIEQAAGMMYSETPYPQMADGPNVSKDFDLTRDRAWVIAANGDPVGFVIVREFADAVHIHEIDVHPRCARRGLGRQLIEHVAAWARTKRATKLTLTTFGDVPWNGPYYSRLGFSTIPVDTLSERLRETLQAEAAAGFPMTHRVAMQLIL
jgi:GNAT superfamily N-acetyltransferase